MVKWRSEFYFWACVCVCVCRPQQQTDYNQPGVGLLPTVTLNLVRWWFVCYTHSITHTTYGTSARTSASTPFIYYKNNENASKLEILILLWDWLNKQKSEASYSREYHADGSDNNNGPKSRARNTYPIHTSVFVWKMNANLPTGDFWYQAKHRKSLAWTIDISIKSIILMSLWLSQNALSHTHTCTHIYSNVWWSMAIIFIRCI